MQIAVLYRWRVHHGHEQTFASAWRTVTDAIVATCKSFGSCLHVDSDGIMVGYARWPSEAARKECFAGHNFSDQPHVVAARATMKAAIAETLPEQVLTIINDALNLPRL
jgi:hypothetical protein